jgi:hypothetical protein
MTDVLSGEEMSEVVVRSAEGAWKPKSDAETPETGALKFATKSIVV